MAYIAQLLGLYLALSGVLMIVKEQATMVLVPKLVDSPPFLYFLGSLRVLIGLAIVLAHTMWVGTLGAVVIVIGWVTLLRGIAMLLLPSETERKILTRKSSEDGGVVLVPSFVLKPGTRMIREWRGQTCSVLVQKDGFQWRGTTYRSLTTIAKEITGAHWSGPRFFGLTSHLATKPSAGAGHVEA